MADLYDCAVIGAGPAGLAVTACLNKRGVNTLVIERSKKIANSWHNHYERLHLHTYRNLSALPMTPWKRGTPRYPSREQVVDYMQEYAKEHEIEPEFGREVKNAKHDGEAWTITADDAQWRAKSLVVASGYNRVPYTPTWPGLDDYQGDIMHSSKFKTGRIYKEKRSLVVGSGNSGAEIAVDLHEQGASSSICIRGPVHITARDLYGMPAQVAGILLSKLPRSVGDKLAVSTSKRMFGDMSEFGITRPEIGPLTGIIEHGRVPLIDVGTIDLIKNGELRVLPGIERFTPTGCVFKNGEEHDFDVVVLATGYRSGLAGFFDNADEYVKENGKPKEHADANPFPGPYFVGFDNTPTGLLRDIHHQAKRTAASIQRGLS